MIMTAETEVRTSPNTSRIPDELDRKSRGRESPVERHYRTGRRRLARSPQLPGSGDLGTASLHRNDRSGGSASRTSKGRLSSSSLHRHGRRTKRTSSKEKRHTPAALHQFGHKPSKKELSVSSLHRHGLRSTGADHSLENQLASSFLSRINSDLQTRKSRLVSRTSSSELLTSVSAHEARRGRRSCAVGTEFSAEGPLTRRMRASSRSRGPARRRRTTRSSSTDLLAGSSSSHHHHHKSHHTVHRVPSLLSQGDSSDSSEDGFEWGSDSEEAPAEDISSCYRAEKSSSSTRSPPVVEQETKGRAPRTMAGGVVKIQILQGRGLVAKNRDMFGRGLRSDPYVVVSWKDGSRGKGWVTKFETDAEVGTLNPEFNQTYTLELGAQAMTELLLENRVSQNLEFQVFDSHGSETDAFMGSVTVNAGQSLSPSVDPQWHRIRASSLAREELYCSTASGELQLKIWVEARLMHELEKGSLLRLPTSSHNLALELLYKTEHKVDVDVSCVAVDRKGKIDWDETAYFSQPSTTAISIRDCMLRMNLDRAPEHLLAYYYVIHVRTPGHTVEDLSGLRVRLLQGKHRQGLCRYVCSQAPRHTGQIVLRMARVDRHDWALVPISHHVANSVDVGTLVPHLQSLTRDLIPRIKVRVTERRALLRPEHSVSMLDYCPTGAIPDALKWAVEWSCSSSSIGSNKNNQNAAKASLVLLDKKFRVVSTICADKPNGYGIHYSKRSSDSEAFFLISARTVPSHVQYIGTSIGPASVPEKDSTPASPRIGNSPKQQQQQQQQQSPTVSSEDLSRTSTNSASSDIRQWLKQRVQTTKFKGNNGGGNGDHSVNRGSDLSVGSVVTVTSKDGEYYYDADEDKTSLSVSGIQCELEDPFDKIVMGTGTIRSTHSLTQPLLVACFSRDTRNKMSWKMEMVSQASNTDDVSEGWKAYLRSRDHDHSNARSVITPQQPSGALSSLGEWCARVVMPEQVPYSYPINFLVTEESLSKTPWLRRKVVDVRQSKLGSLPLL